MPRLSTFSVLLLLAFAVPVTDVMAQSSAGRGAVGGAIIGGAVGGRRGAAVGAATGAVVGAHHRHRHWHGHYYWRMAVAGSAPAGGRIRYLHAIAGKLRVPYGPSAFAM